MSGSLGEVLKSASSSVIRSFRKYGAAKTIQLIVRNLFVLLAEYRERHFSKTHDVEIGDKIPLSELQVESKNKEHGEGYFRTPFSVIRRYRSALPKDLSDYVFVDIGSGKGPIMFYAARYNFKKIIGLEFAEELHEICLNNISSFKDKHQLCRHIESVKVDATEFDFPNENLVIFMFNPFRPEVLEKLISNLRRHFEEYGKKIYIAYYNPRYSRLLLSQSFLRPIAPESPILFVSVHPIWPLAVFETVES